MPDQLDQPSDETVVDAAIISVCCALDLQEKGRNVTIVDRLEPGEAPSYGNAGVILPWSRVLQNIRGILKNGPKRLLNPHVQVRAHLSSLPRLLPCSLSFFRNA